jgi:orotate phosphoribosyltransferase
MQAVHAVRARGASVNKIITLVDRLEGATENLGKEASSSLARYDAICSAER